MILDQFNSKVAEYMKNKDAEKLQVLRFFLAQVKNKEIELRPQNITLNDEHVFKVLKKLLKQIDETILMCEKANRTEKLDASLKEKAILTEFMKVFPEDLSQK